MGAIVGLKRKGEKKDNMLGYTDGIQTGSELKVKKEGLPKTTDEVCE